MSTRKTIKASTPRLMASQKKKLPSGKELAAINKNRCKATVNPRRLSAIGLSAFLSDIIAHSPLIRSLLQSFASVDFILQIPDVE